MATILVVDDRTVNRDFLVTLLGYAHHRVLQASDGAEALATVRVARPDLVICAVLMPRMDGYEFVRQLRADSSVADTKVIFFSASCLGQDAHDLARAGGVLHVLTKPCPPEEILRVVDQALARTVPTAQAGVALDEFDRAHLRLITDKLSKMDDEQRESERRFSALMANVQLVSLMLDRNGLITYCNDYFLRLTGWQRFEVIGRDWFDLFAPPEDLVTKGVFADLLTDSPAAWHNENEIVTRDGSRRLIRWNNTLLRSATGDVIGTASIGEDITEQHRAEDEILETRNFLSTIFDNIPNFIFVKEADTLRFVRVNAAGEQLLGYTEREMLGKNDYDFFPKEQADFFTAKDRETFTSSERVFIFEEAITRKDGTTRLLQTKKLPIRDKFGQPQYLLGIAEDITERKLADQRIRESEAKYRQLIEQASDGIFTSDGEGNFLIVNTRGCELLGYAKDELIGLNVKVTYLDEERDNDTARTQAVGAGNVLRYERMVKRKDGSVFPAEISLKKLEDGLVQVIFHDITARREQERKIARLSRIHAVLSGINAAVVRVRDRQSLFDEACKIATLHGAFRIAALSLRDRPDGPIEAKSIAGLPRDFLSNHDRDLTHPSPKGVAIKALDEGITVVDNDIGLHPDIDAMRREAVGLGCRAVIGLPLFLDNAVAGVMVLYSKEQNFFDDEEVKLLEELAGDVSFALTFIAQKERVEFLAYYDPLTGLPNRSLFFDRLSHQLGTAARNHSTVALILIDLNRFRLINDSLGRQAGDALLSAVAKRLSSDIRQEDAIARVGPNRFALAMSGTWRAAEGAHVLESRSRACFERTFLIGGVELRVSASAGVAVFPADAQDTEALFANAEAALRSAQSENVPFQFYGPEMNARMAESLHLENRLKRALANGELVLWYQPKVELRSGRLVGFEALMRWQDPESGLVPPSKFIPLMEQTGLIVDAGRWALARVSQDCASWPALDGKPVRIAVNVSPLQLRQKDFVDTVIEAAGGTEAAGAALDIEITESVIMQNFEATIQKLQTIRGLGVEISIDDFGTGYSSLAYVARLPIHALKIDRSFVAGVAQSEDSLAIVRSVISLAHSLRLIVIAEGVETEEQLELLRGLNCDEIQGYLISRPMPPEQVPAFIAGRSAA